MFLNGSHVLCAWIAIVAINIRFARIQQVRIWSIKMAKDRFQAQVKAALIKDLWSITHDPFSIQISEAVRLQIDLGAENTIAAQREREKIAVEIKQWISFNNTEQ